MQDALSHQEISKEQYACLYLRQTMLDKSYVHFFIVDVIKEDENTITFMQHVVTTKD